MIRAVGPMLRKGGVCCAPNDPGCNLSGSAAQPPSFCPAKCAMVWKQFNEKCGAQLHLLLEQNGPAGHQSVRAMQSFTSKCCGAVGTGHRRRLEWTKPDGVEDSEAERGEWPTVGSQHVPEADDSYTAPAEAFLPQKGERLSP